MTAAHNNTTWPPSFSWCILEVPEASLLLSHLSGLHDAEAEQGCPWRTSPLDKVKEDSSRPLGGVLNL